MNDRNEQVARVRNLLTMIQGNAYLIDTDTKVLPKSRALARRIMEIADDLTESVIALLKVTPSREEIREAVANSQKEKV